MRDLVSVAPMNAGALPTTAHGSQEEADEIRRLGKRELGPHAFEQQMPARIAALLRTEEDQGPIKNKLTGIIPTLVRLLEHDRRVETAYLCHEDTMQVCKLSGEGNHFCGYRNIQMLMSLFPRGGKLHSIPELQEMIEKAWDLGYNPHGRVETGGVRGTRKHIGTSEAQALFQSKNIPCTAKAFAEKDAWKKLLDAIEKYFTSSEVSTPSVTGVFQTKHPPIFLQRPRHSITVVGIKRLRNGKRALLTFDPAYQPPSDLKKKGLGSDLNQISARLILWRYSRDEAYLKRYRAFEALFLDEAV